MTTIKQFLDKVAKINFDERLTGDETVNQLLDKANGYTCPDLNLDTPKGHMQQAFNDAINFAIELDLEAASFLTLWRAGEWEAIAVEFPEFKLP